MIGDLLKGQLTVSGTKVAPISGVTIGRKSLDHRCLAERKANSFSQSLEDLPDDFYSI